MAGASRGHVIVIGSGLAGLAAARAAARAGARVTVLTPARAGRDGSTHRVHALAPWILLTAPWVPGDGPKRFFADLRSHGEGFQRDEVTECFAERAHAAAVELCGELDLAPVSRQPVLLPGDEVARGLRCQPLRATPLLAPLLAECLDLGVTIRDRALAIGLAMTGDRVSGVLLRDRSAGEMIGIDAASVVLACGGVGAVFPRTTAPRWCRGSAIALAGAAGALLHHPNLTQAIPVTATPPLYFPTTAAVLGSRIRVGERALLQQSSLEAATIEIAGALRRGESVTLEPADEAGMALLPARVRESPTFGTERRVPLAVAVHHAIGGVAIDCRGRTSIAGLYACGEAAGGVQGRRRMMGTGLLEASIFGALAGAAAGEDAARHVAIGGERRGPDRNGAAVPEPPSEPERLERALDGWLGPLACVRPVEEVASALAEIESWPPAGRDEQGRDAVWLAAIRRAAALAMLRAEAGQSEADLGGRRACGGGRP